MLNLSFVFQLSILLVVSGNIHFFNSHGGSYDGKYSTFPESQRIEMREEARKMFYFGYDNYMKYAFPKDELDPIHCTGRGPDYEHPENININDVLGDYALTLVDTLDTLAIMGNSSEFKKAVRLVIENVSFEKSNTIQVFEATIRVLGGLLSAHLIIIDSRQPFGDMTPSDYDNELLLLAHDLAARLLPAFDRTATGIPYPRVNLRDGVPQDCMNETCTAGAGTLLLEFGILSRLLEDPTYESLARRAVRMLWKYKSNVTGLFGNVINIQTGQWSGIMSGVGAGLDSFYEYMLKTYILFADPEDLKRFSKSYETIKFYMRKGRDDCNHGNGFTPLYVNVNMKDGEMINYWIDALQAAWPGVQVLAGDIEDAICTHALHWAIWRKYGALPERYNWQLQAPDVSFYPLRPELVESTYLLYQATKNPFYLHVGRDILQSLNNYTKVKCGYATIHDVRNKTELEDRMESFFLSETCKYLYLLFDKENYINENPDHYIFSTEGHLLPLGAWLRKRPDGQENTHSDEDTQTDKVYEDDDEAVVVVNKSMNNTSCQKIPEERTFFLPIKSRYLQQIEAMIGLD